MAIEYLQRLRDSLLLFGIAEKDDSKVDEPSFNKGPSSIRQLSQAKKDNVLIFDFGLVLKHQTTYHSGLIFSAVTP